MIAEKQESSVRFSRLIDALFPPAEFRPPVPGSYHGTEIPLPKLALPDETMTMALGLDALLPCCRQFFWNPLLRTLSCLLKQALHLILAGHAFA